MTSSSRHSAFSLSQWPLAAFAALLVYLGHQEYRLRQLERTREAPSIATRAQAVQTPAAAILDFYLPRRRMTIREALGNPVYLIDPARGSIYLVHLVAKETGPSGAVRKKSYSFEINTATHGLLPRNEHARRLLTGSPEDDKRWREEDHRREAQPRPVQPGGES